MKRKRTQKTATTEKTLISTVHSPPIKANTSYTITSQSTSQQKVIPHDDLLPRDQFLPIKENNFIFCPDTICTKCPVMVEILKGHPIFKALTLSKDVPEIYIQQFWNTITYNPTVLPHKFEAVIEDFHVAFTLKQFRRMFDLTSKQEYDDFASEEELCAHIVRLGYEEPLPKASAFRRRHLSQVWATLFSIINRCLTSKCTGMDQCSISVLRIFQGIAFNKNYDYARLLWNDLMEVVKDKHLPSKARKFVPFLRFLKIIIFSIMRRNKDIPRRPNDPTIADFKMQYLRRDCGNSNLQGMRIPDELLAYADQKALCVIEYRNSSPQMIQLKPKDSTHVGSAGDPKRTQGGNIQGYSRRRKGSTKVGISRGSEGTPTGVKITPALNVGHRVESVAVRTEPLSGPCVSDVSKFVSREYLDGALKAVQESFDKKLAYMQRLLDEKHVATEEAMLPPPAPPRSLQQDVSVVELKQSLHTKLLSQSEDESVYADLIMNLRRQSEVSQNSAAKEDATNSRKSINAALEKSSACNAALEQSVESQAHDLKRRHDDHDPDHNEGKKRQISNDIVVWGDLNVQTTVPNEDLLEKVQGNSNEAGDNVTSDHSHMDLRSQSYGITIQTFANRRSTRLHKK